MLYKRCDLDGDGVIDWHDFLLSACDKKRIINRYNIEEAYYSFDIY
jgi:hypothetical protein